MRNENNSARNALTTTEVVLTFEAQTESIGLTDEDLAALKTLEDKLQLVRDRTAAAARGYSTGLFLCGTGGIGKTYTVLDELDRQRAAVKLFNSRMTGRGLFDALQAAPDAVHVLEDVEQIFRDQAAMGVLRSALWSQENDRLAPERLVTWTTANQRAEFIFTGAVILISNRQLPDVPELQALKTRIASMHLQVTDAEMRAMMRNVAMQGYQLEDIEVTPAQCWRVCQFLIDEATTLRRSLDMRLLVCAFRDFVQFEEAESGYHWTDLVAARLRDRPVRPRMQVNTGSRAQRILAERRIARELEDSCPDRATRRRLWAERTGKSEAAFYRRLAETY